MITVETSFSSLDMPMKYDHGNRRSLGDGVGRRVARRGCTYTTRHRSACIMSHKTRRRYFSAETRSAAVERFYRA